MRRGNPWVLAALVIILLAGSGLICVAVLSERGEHATQAAVPPQATAASAPLDEVTATPQPEGESSPAPAADGHMDPYAILSQEAMLETIDALASIQPYSGWRNSATSGEAEALDYVDRALDAFGYLAGLGMEQARQSFEVPLGTEQWESGLVLTVDGRSVHVPASGLRGSRSDPALAANFDSDGLVGDSQRDPVVVEGPVVRIGSADEVVALAPGSLAGRVVLLDYAVIDPIVQRGMEQAVSTATTLLAHEPAGLVVVTRFSNEPDGSHAPDRLSNLPARRYRRPDYVGDLERVRAGGHADRLAHPSFRGCSSEGGHRLQGGCVRGLFRQSSVRQLLRAQRQSHLSG